MARRFQRLLVVVLFAAFVPLLSANGFGVFDLSARAATLGGAFTGRADDSSALYYNLGGAAFLKGLRFKANLFFSNLPTKAYVPEIESSYSSSPMQYRGGYYATWHFSDRITLGLAGFTPYFSTMDLPWNWPGKALNIKSNLGAVYVRPALAVKLFENLSVGFGVDFVSARMDWWHGQIFPLRNSLTHGRMVESHYESKGSGTGYAAGALWKAHKRIQIGVRYQHKVKVKLEGTQRLWAPDSIAVVEIPNASEYPLSLTQVMREFRIPQPVTAEFTLPAEFAVGLMVIPWDRLALHLDFVWRGWSEFGDWEYAVADPEADLNQNFYDLYQETYGTAPSYGTQGFALGSKDVWSTKFGLEFKLSQVLSLRSGYSFNPSAIPNQALSPINPDLDQQVFTLGLGYEGPLFSIWDYEEQGGFSFDVYLKYMMSEEKQSDLPGFKFVYDTDYWILGVGVGLTS